MAFEVVSKGEQVTLATETGDDGAHMDVTGCLSDGSSAVSCVEVKATQGIRAEWPHSPSVMSSATIRTGVESAMTSGTLRAAPYSDFNTINNTNGATTVSISAGGDVDTAISAAFIADSLAGLFTFRLFENGSGAKIKVGELSVEATIATAVVSGVTKDFEGNVLVSCGVHLFKKISGAGPDYVFEFVDSQVSDGTTGAYSFTVDDDGSEYMVYAIKNDSPHVFDATNHVLTGA